MGILINEAWAVPNTHQKPLAQHAANIRLEVCVNSGIQLTDEHPYIAIFRAFLLLTVLSGKDFPARLSAALKAITVTGHNRFLTRFE